MSILDELSGHRVGLGTAGFAFGKRTSAESIDTVLAAVHSGVRLVDTARAYTRRDEDATAEQIVGSALRLLNGEQLFVSTKGGHWRSGDEFPVDGRRAMIRAHCHGSLRALGVETIDLYQLHHVDLEVPLAESVATLAELQSEGAVRHIGLSNIAPAQLAQAQQISPIAAVQNPLSLTDRRNACLARQCAREGIAFLAYSPLGGAGAIVPPSAAAVAARHAVSPQRILLSWVLAQSPAVFPLVGATRAQTIRDSAAATDVLLSAEDLAELDDDAPIHLARGAVEGTQGPAKLDNDC